MAEEPTLPRCLCLPTSEGAPPAHVDTPAQGSVPPSSNLPSWSLANSDFSCHRYKCLPPNQGQLTGWCPAVSSATGAHPPPAPGPQQVPLPPHGLRLAGQDAAGRPEGESRPPPPPHSPAVLHARLVLTLPLSSSLQISMENMGLYEDLSSAGDVIEVTHRSAGPRACAHAPQAQSGFPWCSSVQAFSIWDPGRLVQLGVPVTRVLVLQRSHRREQEQAAHVWGGLSLLSV